MDTVKKFVKYVLLVIVGYILVNVLSFGIISNTYHNVKNYEILAEVPSVEIKESKATKINGYIVGNIENKTDALIFEKYLRINFYNQRNQYVGTNYVDINQLQAGKALEFKTSYKYIGVESFTVDITDQKIEQREDQRIEFSPRFDRVMAMFGILMIIWFVF